MNDLIFRDRRHAGRLLANALNGYDGCPDEEVQRLLAQARDSWPAPSPALTQPAGSTTG